LYEELEELEHSGVALDADLITRKKERTLRRIADLNRKPQEVDWSRR
jgi:hypothetical protein